MANIKPLYRAVLPLVLFLGAAPAWAGDADIHLPPLEDSSLLDGEVSSHAILFMGLAICAVGVAFGFLEYWKTRALPAHRAMRDVSHIIWETCKTYLLQQGNSCCCCGR